MARTKDFGSLLVRQTQQNRGEKSRGFLSLLWTRFLTGVMRDENPRISSKKQCPDDVILQNQPISGPRNLVVTFSERANQDVFLTKLVFVTISVPHRSSHFWIVGFYVNWSAHSPIRKSVISHTQFLYGELFIPVWKSDIYGKLVVAVGVSPVLWPMAHLPTPTLPFNYILYSCHILTPASSCCQILYSYRHQLPPTTTYFTPSVTYLCGMSCARAVSSTKQT